MCRTVFNITVIFLVIFHLASFQQQAQKQRSKTTENEIKEIHLKYLNFMQNFQTYYDRYNARMQYDSNKPVSNLVQWCQDPNEEFMLMHHLNLINYFQEFIGMLNLKEVKHMFQDIILKSSDDQQHQHIDPSVLTDCPYKFPGLKPTGLCHSQNVLHMRTNIYPSIRNQVKCTCDKCLNTKQNDIIFRCKEVRILTPGLMRDHTKCVNNFYEWKPILEYVSVACECLPVRI